MIVMTVIVKKLGENDLLDYAFCIQEQADRVGHWLYYHEQRPVEVVCAFLVARYVGAEVVSCTYPISHKLLVAPVDKTA